jgi:membrane-associated phospholipid phosphatase
MFRVHSSRTQLRLMAVEIILLVYLFITGVLIIVFSHKLDHKATHLFVRSATALIIGTFSYIEFRSKSKRYIKFFRLVFPFIILVYVYRETAYLNRLFFANSFDPFFSRVELYLFHAQPSFVFARHFSSDFFAELMYLGYFAYYLMVLYIPIHIYFFKSRYLAEHSVFIIITSFVTYYIVFIIFPVVGPQFYYNAELSKLPHGIIFGPILKYILDHGEVPTAAFPSSHVSICLMLLIICFRYAKKLLFLNLPISVLLLFSTVYIRAHYLVDVIAGVFFTPFVYAYSSYLFSILTKKLSKQNFYTLTHEYSNQRSKKSA